MSESFQIAIDGPVAAGKGTVSRLLAQKLGFLYVDTGAMYRVVALLALRHNVDFADEEQIVALFEKSKLEMKNPSDPHELDGRLITVILDDEDVSWAIRTQECSDGSSKVAVLPELRRVLVQKQQEIANNHNIVMEGRDITFRVLPNADLKIFLTANVASRATRRHVQYLNKGVDVSIEKVVKEIESRDQFDIQRETDPLQIIPSDWVLDTSHLEIEEVVDLIIQKVEKIRKQK